MRFSVLTLNLWNVNEPLAARFPALEAGLKVLRPDIVCLQEVARDPRSGRRQSDLVARMGDLPYAIDKDQLSILSRMPILISHSADLPEVPQDEPRQVLMAETLIDGRPLLICNTHLAWRLEWIAERKAQADTLLAAIERHGAAGQMKILCGDFNDDPDSPALRAVLDHGIGFHDSHAQCHRGDLGFTWSRKNPYVHPSTTRDQRIDYIFAAGDLAAMECAVVFDGRNGLNLASDHYGVLATFELR